MRMIRGTRMMMLGLTAGALLAAAGCGRPDALSDAIINARNTLTALTGSGASAAPAELRERKYAQVVKALQDGISAGGDPASLSSANLLLAQAIAGQAEMELAKARGIDRRLSGLITEAQAELSVRLRERSIAQSLRAFDSRPALAELESKTSDRAAEQAQLTSALNGVLAQVQKLDDQAEQMNGRATEIRAREREARRDLVNADASVRSSMAQQIADLARTGDEAERGAALFEAEVKRISPRADELRRELQRVQTQIDALARAKENLGGLQTSRSAGAKASDGRADDAEKRMGEIVAQVRTLITDELRPAYENAISKYTGASSKASSGRTGGSRLAVGVLGGSIQHGVAGANRELGQALARAVALLRSMTEGEPAPGSAGEWNAYAAELEEGSKQSLEAAAQAYGSAASAFQGAGGGAGITALGEQFTIIEKQLKGEPIEPPAPAEGEAAPAEGEAVPEAEGGDQSGEEGSGDMPAPEGEQPTEDSGEESPTTEPQETPEEPGEGEGEPSNPTGPQR